MNTPPFTFQSWQRKIDRLILLPGLFACALSLTSLARAQDAAAAASDAAVLRPAYGVAWDSDPQPDLANFSAWAQTLVKSQKARAAASASDAASVTTGVRLAERRRFVLAALAQTDPARALAVGIPAAVRAKLPAEVVSRLEIPFSATGNYSVDRPSGRREIEIDGRVYAAHVYGRRTALTSLHNLFLHGFLLDGEAVLDTSVLRVLPAEGSDRRFLVDGGGRIYRFESLAQIQQAETHLRAVEARLTDGSADAAEKTALESSPGATAASTTTTSRIAKERAPQPQSLNGNDSFAHAYRLTGSSGSVFDSNVGATSEQGEPRHAGDGGGSSVWYVWTPRQTGEATFTTDDDQGHFALDTVLAAYIGSNVANLSPVASNDDYTGLNSQITFLATAGVTYHIAVDGFGSVGQAAQGSFTLSYFQEGDTNSPTITSFSTVVAELNARFIYTIAATNDPTSFSATGLPTGLSLNPTTGVISGTPTTLGFYAVIVSATNASGTGSATLGLTVTDQPIHLPFFTTEVALPQSPGIYYLHLVHGNVFGYYGYLTDQNYIYHLDLGYEYTFDAGDEQNGIFFYDFASDTFFYTSPTFPFPYLYDFKLNTVLYYYPSPTDNARFNTNGIRYFYDFATGQIITK